VRARSTITLLLFLTACDANTSEGGGPAGTALADAGTSASTVDASAASSAAGTSAVAGACTVDAECTTGACFEGRCVGTAQEGGPCDLNCGIPLGTNPPPWSCFDCLACVDDRCRRCDDDDQCWPYVCNTDSGRCEKITLPSDAGANAPIACTNDDDCPPLPDNPAWARFCDLGTCVPLGYDPPFGHGAECPHPTAACTPEDCCFPYACIEGRCRSCTTDEDCGPDHTCADGLCG